MSEKKDYTILCWTDRKIVVEHVSLPEVEAWAHAESISDSLGGSDACSYDLCDGHLPVHLNERTNPS